MVKQEPKSHRTANDADYTNSANPAVVNAKGRTRYFKEMAQKAFDIPIYVRKKFKWKTFKCWLRTYRTEGFDGLPTPIKATPAWWMIT